MTKGKKFQLLLFYCLLALLPCQLGLHFWPDWAFFNGIRVDYFSPTLFLTDILLALLFLLSFKDFSFSRNKTILIAGLIIFAGLNSYFSLSPAVSVYKWLKLAEMGLFYLWIKYNFKYLSLKWLVTSLALAVSWQFILVLGQFLAQHSIGGWWYFLGERNFSLNTPGIATLYIGGDQVLRPYGTFSHPNVLAGFLTVVIILNAEFLRYKCGKKIKQISIWTIVIGQIALLLTLSLPAILVNFIALALIFGRQRLLMALLLPTLGLVAIKLTGVGFYEQSLLPRQELITPAVHAFLNSPLIGQGLGVGPLLTAQSQLNLGNLALLVQPVHNFWLLLLAETGLGGTIFILVQLLRRKLTVILAAVVVLSLLDHYFLTSQQGLLTLVVALAFSFPSFPGTMKR